MTSPDRPPFILQPLISDLYKQAQDLLDLNATDNIVSTPVAASPASPSGTSLFGTATSIAAAAGRRAAAVASGASPSALQTSKVGSPGTANAPSSASPDRSRANVSDTSPKGKEIRCVEGYGQNMYIGGSDGTVEWWVCDGGAGTSKAQGWTMRHKHTLFPRRPVGRIVLIPKVSKMLVLSDGTMHALSIPSLEPIPSQAIPPLRGVSSIILDDNEMEWGGPGSEDRNAEVTVVVVRRRGLGIYKLGGRMQPVKEIPLPSGPTSHALTHTYLCAAIPASGTYSIIDLSDASLTEVLPISQVETDVLEWDPNPNVVVIPGEDEFLVTSYTGVGTMGVFLNGQGDPVRGTMEWEEHPISIAIDSGYIIALLRNNTVTIHALTELDKPIQSFSLDTGFQPFTLSYSPYGVSIRDAIRDERLATSPFTILGGRLRPPATIARTVPVKDVPIASPTDGGMLSPAAGRIDGGILSPSSDTMSPSIEDPPSGSGLTPPSSPPKFTRQPILPTRQSSLLQSTAPPVVEGPFSTAVAETLVVGRHGVMSIAPRPTLLLVEQLCAERKMDEAIVVVDEERRKGRRGEIDADKATHQGTVRFLHLYLAFNLFLNGMFERAGEYFHRGKVDPRLIVRTFSDLRGKLIGSEEEVDVYGGLCPVLGDMPDVRGIVDDMIKRNFTDEKQDDAGDMDVETTSKSDPSPDSNSEVREALLETANAMLVEFLRKTRQSRRKGGGSRGVDSRKIDIIIDTTLAKLLALSEATNELLAMLAASNDCVLAEVEPFLVSKPYVLATVLRKQGKHERVLELLKQVAENPDGDPLCPDPISEITHELEEVKDPVVVRKFALWLIGRDEERGISLLLAHTPTSGAKVNEQALVEEIRAVSEQAANRYLEHVVVVKKSPNRAMHEDLLKRLLDAVESEVKDDGVKYHLEELDAEYRLLADPEPFCVFFADIAPDTPIKRLRLKTMLFLEASPFFDLDAMAMRLEGVSQLKYELAIVLGRLGRNRPALELLARDIGDSVSAQTFCTQAGEVIPPRIAHRIAQRVPELAAWAALCDVGRKKRETSVALAAEAKMREGLVMDLLGVYMRDGASTSRQTAALLNAQSQHLDTLRVLEMVPPDWPVDAISSFTQRALRRQMHERCSWQVLKAISAGQNMYVAERYLAASRKVPPVVQMPMSGNGDGNGHGDGDGGEETRGGQRDEVNETEKEKEKTMEPSDPSPGAESEKSEKSGTTHSGTEFTDESMDEKARVYRNRLLRGEEGGFSRPDEGSVAEVDREIDNGAGGAVGGGGEGGGGVVGMQGFFSPEVVDKELKRVERRLERQREREMRGR